MRSSKRCCSSVPAQSSTACITSRTCGAWACCAKLMPVTAVTFIIGWLAIAGVPPFAGFWSKDEILLSAFEKSPILWVVGLVTALLTAFYMTRQVIMVFFGEARWHDAHEEHGRARRRHARTRARRSCCSHLSSWRGCPSSVGRINLPFTDSIKRLEHWLEPVIGEVEHHVTASSGTKVGLAVVGDSCRTRRHHTCVVRLHANAVAHPRTRVPRPGLALRRVAGQVHERPGSKAVRWSGLVRYEDRRRRGRSIAAETKNLGTVLRKLQTGYVRQYVGGVSIGAVLLLAWFLIRGVL